MSSAGIILDMDKMIYFETQTYLLNNILLFALLLLLVVIPWLKYDKYIINVNFAVNEKYINSLKFIYSILFVLSIVCIIYCLPYAIAANSLGAETMRQIGCLMPISFMTTFATGIATLAPIGILLFFIGLLSPKLVFHAVLILILPIASIIHSMTFAARELYIFLPLTFIIVYLTFKDSLSINIRIKIKQISLIIGILMIISFVTITINRFGKIGTDSFIEGTWGYIYQQPYVFDQTLQFFTNFKAFSSNLSFIGNFLGENTTNKDLELTTEWCFGTMYQAFYEMYGYISLFIGSITYLLVFNYMAKKSIKSGRPFMIMVNFIIFLWFTISGLFYFRYGKIDAQFILYMLIIFLSSLYPPFIICKNKQ